MFISCPWFWVFDARSVVDYGMSEFYSSRQLSAQDHPDIFAMAQAGQTLDDVALYASRPKAEVALYLRRWLPTEYERFVRNEQKKAQG